MSSYRPVASADPSAGPSVEVTAGPSTRHGLTERAAAGLPVSPWCRLAERAGLIPRCGLADPAAGGRGKRGPGPEPVVGQIDHS